MQGVLIRRHRLEKSDGTFFAPGDFVVGDNVSFYGRTFHIVDADVFTRQAMADAGLEYGPAEPYPNDPFTTKKLTTQRHVFGQTSFSLLEPPAILPPLPLTCPLPPCPIIQVAPTGLGPPPRLCPAQALPPPMHLSQTGFEQLCT